MTVAAGTPTAPTLELMHLFEEVDLRRIVVFTPETSRADFSNAAPLVALSSLPGWTLEGPTAGRASGVQNWVGLESTQIARRGLLDANASPLSRHLEVPYRRSWPLVLAGVAHIQKNCWKGWLTSHALTTAAPPGAASTQVPGVVVSIKKTSTT